MEARYKITSYANGVVKDLYYPSKKIKFTQYDSKTGMIDFVLYKDANSPQDGIDYAVFAVIRPGETSADARIYGEDCFVINGNTLSLTLPMGGLYVPGKHNGCVIGYGSNYERLTMIQFEYDVIADYIADKPIEDDEKHQVLTQLIYDVQNIKNTLQATLDTTAASLASVQQTQAAISQTQADIGQTQTEIEAYQAELESAEFVTEGVYVGDDILIDPSTAAGINASLSNITKNISEFPLIIPEVNDTGRLKRAINSGYNIKGKKGDTYVVDDVSLYTSNICIDLNGATLKANSKTSQGIYIGNNEAGGFTKVSNVTIKNGHFEGIQDDWQTNTNSSIGISIKENQFVRESGCTDITIENCTGNKHTAGVMANGVTRLEVKECHFEDMWYCLPNANGGYGVLLQSCFDVWVHHNTFKGLTGDRHAIYCSCAVGSTYQNENVNIHHNIVDFTGVLVKTGFESAFVIRSTKRLHCNNNTILGSYGGIRLLVGNGDASYYNVSGNTIIGIRHLSNEVGGIDILIDNGYNTSEFIISNNIIDNTETLVRGITVSGATDVSVLNNRINALEYGLIIMSSTKVKASGNNFKTCTTAAIMYNGTLDKIAIGVNFFDEITGYSESVVETCTITNMKHLYTRRANILGTGSSASYNFNPDRLIAAVAGNTYGVDITLTKNAPIANMGDVLVMPHSSTRYYFYVRAVNTSTNTVTIGIMDPAGATINLATVSAEFTLYLTT